MPSLPPSRSSPRSLPERNEVPLTRTLLLDVLQHLSERLLSYFGSTVRLVVHGGAMMVLHPELTKGRDSTRDVDYLHRSFESEWIVRGLLDAGARLRKCIRHTARAFGLGEDWMNACADVALPMSAHPVYGTTYDPIYTHAIETVNVVQNTLFASPGLVLLGVSWPWAVALKLVRYQKHDPQDIAHILRLGRRTRRVQWSRATMERWLVEMCSPMGYTNYSPWQMEVTRQKMRHAISLAFPSSPAASCRKRLRPAQLGCIDLRARWGPAILLERTRSVLRARFVLLLAVCSLYRYASSFPCSRALFSLEEAGLYHLGPYFSIATATFASCEGLLLHRYSTRTHLRFARLLHELTNFPLLCYLLTR
ncbi:hypothetical protein BD413DRAFT_483165 [Trametes elegans]|nr:hypothetical protein BD413DRAFT_483165 [Trametes elegans]